mmetsp:Transcript_61665/g.73206  ORF Transcript_61665/g.73206 Transcript_61665/m.73206 type:complete len:146 (-) Transcript_61665:486-923(-)
MTIQRPIILFPLIAVVAIFRSSHAAYCEDMQDWHGKKSELHNCAHVGEDPENRCHWFSVDNISARDACPRSCNEECGPAALAPTPHEVISCEDSVTWRAKSKPDHDCAEVAGHPEFRCAWENDDGVKASVACKASCDPDCGAISV